MSKISKNYGWLNSTSNSSKTLLERAKREVPGFADHIIKFEEQITIKSYSSSTVFSYSRCIAQISLYCKKSPLDLELDEINSYLYAMKTDRDMSDTFLKHTIYSLRFFYRIYDLEDRAIRLPGMKNKRKLPVVFSQEELRRLFTAPQRLKQRVLLCLIYSAGLRVSEVCKLMLSDIDFDRKQIHVRESKNDKSRYVILSDYIAKGLMQYIKGSKPKEYLFNGKCFHVVFTLPHHLNEIALQKPDLIYGLLFKTAWSLIKDFGHNPKLLGAKMGMIAVLHTWGQNLSLHPHLHCIVPAGGITKSNKWKASRAKDQPGCRKARYLFPVKEIKRVFRARYVAALRNEKTLDKNLSEKLFKKPGSTIVNSPFMAQSRSLNTWDATHIKGYQQ